MHLWPPVETRSAVLAGSRCERLPLSLMVITSDKQDKCEVIAPAGRSEEVGFRAPGRRIRWSVSTAEVVAAPGSSDTGRGRRREGGVAR